MCFPPVIQQSSNRELHIFIASAGTCANWSNWMRCDRVKLTVVNLINITISVKRTHSHSRVHSTFCRWPFLVYQLVTHDWVFSFLLSIRFSRILSATDRINRFARFFSLFLLKSSAVARCRVCWCAAFSFLFFLLVNRSCIGPCFLFDEWRDKLNVFAFVVWVIRMFVFHYRNVRVCASMRVCLICLCSYIVLFLTNSNFWTHDERWWWSEGIIIEWVDDGATRKPFQIILCEEFTLSLSRLRENFINSFVIVLLSFSLRATSRFFTFILRSLPFISFRSSGQSNVIVRNESVTLREIWTHWLTYIIWTLKQSHHKTLAQHIYSRRRVSFNHLKVLMLARFSFAAKYSIC